MFFGYVLIFIASVSNVLADPPKVVVLSFDGIPYSSITDNLTPYLRQLIQEHQGAGPLLMHSLFPTKTMSTHTTIATGVYPRVHGVYNDVVFDSDYNGTPPNQTHFAYNNKILPIWIENQKEGNGRNSGVMMWPGGEYEYQGVRAAHIQPFDKTITWETRVETIVKWLTENDNKANLVMAYFEGYQCNDEGQMDIDLQNHMQRIDVTIQKLYKDLKEKTSDVFEFIFLSDRGTSKVTYNGILKIDELMKDIDVKDYKIIVSGPLVLIKPVTDEIRPIIMRTFDSHPGSTNQFIALGVNDLVDRLSLAIEELSQIIVVRALPGYTFYDSKKLNEMASTEDKKEYFVTNESGYDNFNPDMNTFFTGVGSKFNNVNLTTISFELYDVYPILKCLLNLKTAVHEIQPFRIDETVREILTPEIVPPRQENKPETTDEEKGTKQTDHLEEDQSEIEIKQEKKHDEKDPNKDDTQIEIH